MSNPTGEAADARTDALLRELMTLRLVEPDSQADQQSWRLTRQAQHRLEALASPALPAEKLIYFGHHCARCHLHAATRLRDGAFLCFSCLASPAPEPTPIGADPGPQASRRLFHARSRMETHAQSA